MWACRRVGVRATRARCVEVNLGARSHQALGRKRGLIWEAKHQHGVSNRPELHVPNVSHPHFTSHATNHEQLTNMTPVEDLQHTVTTISRTRRAYRVSLTMKTASSPHNVSSFSRTSKRYSSAEYAWKRCPRTRSLALTLVDTPSVGSACADTFLLAWRSIDSQYYALLAPQIRARARVSREVRACSSHSS